jgi:hypothetical protein
MSESRAYWEQEVLACQSSGKSQMSYARERGISYHKLIYWTRKLQPKESKFIELKPVSRGPAEVVASVGMELELLLPGGVVLRMRGA